MLERWNPTVKAFTVLICVILLSFEYLVSLNLLVLAVCLLLLMFCSRVSLKKDRRHPAAGLHCGVRPVCDGPLLRPGRQHADHGSEQPFGHALQCARGHVAKPVHGAAAGHPSAGLRRAGHPVCTFHRGGLLHCQPAAPVPPPAQVCLWHPGGVPPDAGDGAGVRPGAHGLCGARPESGARSR